MIITYVVTWIVVIGGFFPEVLGSVIGRIAHAVRKEMRKP